MKKVLLVVALLLLATTVFAADVTITATPGTSANLRPVTVRYTGAAEANSIRGFALVLTVDNGALLNNIRDFNRGESTRPGGGFGIFPGKFRDFVNASSPNWVDINYNPLAPWNDLNSQSGDNYMKMVVELGTLFVEPNSPGTAGTLFTVDVNRNGITENDCNMCIAVDATRGGVVKKDATGASVTLPGAYVAGKGNCFKVSFPPGGVTVPDLNNVDRVTAINTLIGLGLVKGVEANVAPTTGVKTVNRVNAQKPIAGTVVAAGSAVDINVVNFPIKWMGTANSFYVNWVTNGRPQCWAYPRQCHGDADGKKQLSYWTGSNDLTILRAAINKTALPAGGSCADFDHKKQLSYWVGSNDLTILRGYINKAEASNPVCGNIPLANGGFSADPNFWYFCLPVSSPATVCPPGQYCAPAGACPNTP